MSSVLVVAAATLPAAAAAVIALVRPRGALAARWGVAATAVTWAASVGVAVATVSAPVTAVIELGAPGVIVGFTADVVGAVLALLTTGVAAVVQSFAARALDGDPRQRRFVTFALLLTAATTGVALAATLALVALTWTVTTVALTALVAHRNEWSPARRAARRTAGRLAVGDAALATAALVAVVTIGDIDLREPARAAASLAGVDVAATGIDGLTVVALLLVVAAISRSALVPLHTWLPATLAAPTPVSALLHAGVVNGGGVLLVRVAPLFGSSPLATHVAFVAGVLTVIFATAVMLVRSDVKGSLAWSTAGQMGFMTLQIAVGAFAAALFHLVGHGMYKAALFLGSGGAVTAHLRHRRRPGPETPVPGSVRAATATLAPAGGLVVAYALVDPHLPAAADLLVVLFAGATAARAAHGWLAAAPFRPLVTVISATAGTVLGLTGYLAGLAAFEGAVAALVPHDVPGAVETTTLVAVLVAAGVGVAAVRLAPGAAGARLRDRVYARLLTAAVPRPDPSSVRGRLARRRTTGRRIAPAAEDSPATATRRARGRVDETPSDTPRPDPSLRADVARAAELVAPLWPLTGFVAVNPLGGLSHLPFDDAAAEARRWLGARTHPTLAEFRAAYTRGAISDGDLRAAIRAGVPALADAEAVTVGGRHISPVEVVRLDLVAGPDELDPLPAANLPFDPDTARSAAGLVATWCAAYVDDGGAAWAMPHRDAGFYRAWRELAPGDRRLRARVGRPGVEGIRTLPERPTAALAAALAALGVTEDERVDVLRYHLSRLHGWASYARWCDDWAQPTQAARTLRLVELLAVHVATTAAIAAAQGARVAARVGDTGALAARRVDAVAAALGTANPDDHLAHALGDVLAAVPEATRSALWLEAHERAFRDRFLGLLDTPRAAPSPHPDAIQVVFCIDVRAEGMRRHLEACGDYETFGFAGFFGVPMRWRPWGATVSEPRAPVLVTPRHEVDERPATDAARHPALTRGRAARAGHDAFAAAKRDLAAPFALAEASGWALGPLAAVRTLAPSLSARVARRGRRRATATATRPAVVAELDDTSGLTCDERALFAEAILDTLCLTHFAPLVVLCGHGSDTVNNPHAASYDCGACGGAPGGASARTAAAILNDTAVRSELLERGISIPAETWFAAAEHDTASDEVTLLDRDTIPDHCAPLVARFERDVATAGAQLARERAARLPGRAATVRTRGGDWAQVRPEWGLAGNAAFVIGPRAITRDLDLACRVFLHSYDADADADGGALETILTAPLVVAQWISAQYYFSTVDPVVFGAGDKMLHNPVGGTGVLLGDGGDLRTGLPDQAVRVGHERVHEPLRLLAVVEAPQARIDDIIGRNQVLQDLVGGRWIRLAARADATTGWSLRDAAGGWAPWEPALDSIATPGASLERT